MPAKSGQGNSRQEKNSKWTEKQLGSALPGPTLGKNTMYINRLLYTGDEEKLADEKEYLAQVTEKLVKKEGMLAEKKKNLAKEEDKLAEEEKKRIAAKKQLTEKEKEQIAENKKLIEKEKEQIAENKKLIEKEKKQLAEVERQMAEDNKLIEEDRKLTSEEKSILKILTTETMKARIQFECDEDTGGKKTIFIRETGDPGVSFALTGKNFAAVQLSVGNIVTKPKGFGAATDKESTGNPSEHAERTALANAINQAIKSGWEPTYNGQKLSELAEPPTLKKLEEFTDALKTVDIVLFTEKSFCTTDNNKLPQGEKNCRDALSPILSTEGKHKIYYAVTGNKEDRRLRNARDAYYKMHDYEAQKLYLDKHRDKVEEARMSSTGKSKFDGRKARTNSGSNPGTSVREQQAELTSQEQSMAKRNLSESPKITVQVTQKPPKVNANETATFHMRAVTSESQTPLTSDVLPRSELPSQKSTKKKKKNKRKEKPDETATFHMRAVTSEPQAPLTSDALPLSEPSSPKSTKKKNKKKRKEKPDETTTFHMHAVTSEQQAPLTSDALPLSASSSPKSTKKKKKKNKRKRKEKPDETTTFHVHTVTPESQTPVTSDALPLSEPSSPKSTKKKKKKNKRKEKPDETATFHAVASAKTTQPELTLSERPEDKQVADEPRETKKEQSQLQSEQRIARARQAAKELSKSNPPGVTIHAKTSPPLRPGTKPLKPPQKPSSLGTKPGR
jgi:hypothetical protein